MFLAGFTGVLGRLITLNESLLVWYRLFITVITMAVLFLFAGRFPPVTFKQLLRIFGVGAVVAMHWVSFYGSVKFSNVSIALVCFSTIGFFSALLEPLIFRRRISPAELALGLLSVIGVYLVFHFDTRFKTGITFGLISALLAAVFTILNKKVLEHNDPKTVSFYELTGGLIFLSCVLPFYLHKSGVPFALPANQDWLWLIILSWLCTVLAFFLSMSALKWISPFTVNLSYNLEPVYGIALAFVIYNENKDLELSFYAGLSLIILSVILQTFRVTRLRKLV